MNQAAEDSTACDGAARPQPPVRLGGLDGRARHAVLHAAGRIGRFELQQQPRRAARNDAAELDERGVADAIKCGHGAAV
jgi:hypothetical protein